MNSGDEQLFSTDLVALGAECVAQKIAEDGVFSMPGALRPETIDRILAECGPLALAININDLSPVFTLSQVFFTHFLAKSETAYNVVTSDLTLDICNRLMQRYALAGKRIYTTMASMNMQWHCDVERPCEDPYDVDATVFIFYLTDVVDGEWQYVRGSHLLGLNFVGNAEMDRQIEAEHGGDIRSVAGPRGTVVIYNGRTFHRARPMQPGSPPRTSLFYQVNRNIAASEPILLNSAFLGNLDERRKMLLGIGQAPPLPTFPKTHLTTMATKDLRRVREHVGKVLQERGEPVDLAAEPQQTNLKSMMTKDLRRVRQHVGKILQERGEPVDLPAEPQQTNLKTMTTKDLRRVREHVGKVLQERGEPVDLPAEPQQTNLKTMTTKDLWRVRKHVGKILQERGQPVDLPPQPQPSMVRRLFRLNNR